MAVQVLFEPCSNKNLMNIFNRREPSIYLLYVVPRTFQYLFLGLTEFCLDEPTHELEYYEVDIISVPYVLFKNYSVDPVIKNCKDAEKKKYLERYKRYPFKVYSSKPERLTNEEHNKYTSFMFHELFAVL